MNTRPFALGAELAAFAGQWVALRDGKVIEAASTPYKLIMDLHAKGIIDVRSDQPPHDITIVRAPEHDEALLVGLG